MSLCWVFFSELPLPAGLRSEAIATASLEQGLARLAEAQALIGREAALELAKKLGRYELDDDCVQDLRLRGACAGKDGELPALSPSRWLEYPEIESWVSFQARLKKEGGYVAGLRLTPEERRAFLDFMARNHVIVDDISSLEPIIELARHFFFAKPLNVVLGYTGPSFAQS